APVTGREGMIGELGTAKTALAPDQPGRVAVRGEIWRAEADAPVEAGADVEVTAIDGLTLTVRGS
ncbi:MAG: NfeD family protein, partial [Acidobacteriota bacterium]